MGCGKARIEFPTMGMETKQMQLPPGTTVHSQQLKVEVCGPPRRGCRGCSAMLTAHLSMLPGVNDSRRRTWDNWPEKRRSRAPPLQEPTAQGPPKRFHWIKGRPPASGKRLRDVHTIHSSLTRRFFSR